MCTVCKTSEEIIKHIFLECTIVRDFWSNLGIDPCTWANDDNWILSIRDLNVTLMNSIINWTNAFTFAIWNILTNRNKNIHENISYALHLSNIFKLAVEYKLLAEKEIIPHNKKPIVVTWHKPSHGFYKLNIDGSFMENSSICGFGGLFRDSNGHWILGFKDTNYGLPPLQTELLALKEGALKEGLRIAHEQGYIAPGS